jgi:hypothetical protein
MRQYAMGGGTQRCGRRKAIWRDGKDSRIPDDHQHRSHDVHGRCRWKVFTFTTAMRSFPSSFSASGRLPSAVTFRSRGNGTAILEGSPDLGTVGRYPIKVAAFDGEGQGVCQEFILAVHRTTSPRAVAVTGYGQDWDQPVDSSLNRAEEPD